MTANGLNEGHGFSRAVNFRNTNRLLAAEERFSGHVGQNRPSGAKALSGQLLRGSANSRGLRQEPFSHLSEALQHPHPCGSLEKYLSPWFP